MKALKDIYPRYVVGFAGMYWTLWREVLEFRRNHHTGQTYECPKAFYIKNLSTDKEQAVEKAEEAAGKPVEVDEGLRGDNWVWRDYQRDALPMGVFAYGKLTGQSISECEDVWQVNRVYADVNSPARRRVIARRRLLELGELVVYPYTDREGGKHKYCPAKLAEYLQSQEAMEYGHFFSAGDRVTLDLTLAMVRSFDTHYGRMYIQTFVDKDSRVFIYKGSSPVDS